MFQNPGCAAKDLNDRRRTMRDGKAAMAESESKLRGSGYNPGIQYGRSGTAWLMCERARSQLMRCSVGKMSRYSSHHFRREIPRGAQTQSASGGSCHPHCQGPGFLHNPGDGSFLECSPRRFRRSDKRHRALPGSGVVDRGGDGLRLH